MCCALFLYFILLLLNILYFLFKFFIISEACRFITINFSSFFLLKRHYFFLVKVFNLIRLTSSQGLFNFLKFLFKYIFFFIFVYIFWDNLFRLWYFVNDFYESVVVRLSVIEEPLFIWLEEIIINVIYFFKNWFVPLVRFFFFLPYIFEKFFYQN
jgi:hypothetical protein